MEAELIAWLRERLPASDDCPLGLWDDAAVVRWRERGDCVITQDAVTDQVDFVLAEIDPRRAGRKALAVNLSDMAAMAARPVAAVVALVLPRHGGLSLAKALYEGMIPLAEQCGVAICGGDTNSWDGPLVVSVAVIGTTEGRPPLRRSGAMAGDWLLVTGALGGSRLGKHLDFEPRIEEAIMLAKRYELHAGMDISDGLALDAARLVSASGCGAELLAERIPIAADAEIWARQLADGSTPLDHALSDGEDFELLLAVPPPEAARIIAEQPLATPTTCVGRCVAERGLWSVDGTGQRRELAPRGYERRLD